MAEAAVSHYSYDAYLALEAEGELKYEYHDGFIVAMAGGTLEHGQIAGNLLYATRTALDKAHKPCRTYSSDVKVRVETTKRTFYPDMSLVCGAPQKSEKDPNALTNPLMIVEVLSESTAAFDLGEKFGHYRTLNSLRDYVIVSQDNARVDTYYRTDDGTWEINSYLELTDEILLKSIGLTIQMRDIYRLVPGIDPEVDPAES